MLYQHLFFPYLPEISSFLNIIPLTSQTFNFDNFINKFNNSNTDKPMPSNEFLIWLIGFTEGDGSFIINKRGDLSFVITQSTSDLQVLDFIKETLGFGKVIKQSVKSNTHRFIIQDRAHLVLISLLFNGNMVFPTRANRFNTFLSALNEKLLKHGEDIIIPIYATVLPTLRDY